MPVPTVKKPAGTLGQPQTIATNLKELVIRPNTSYYKYDLRVHAVYLKKDGGGESLRELTKQTRQDFDEQTRKTMCADVFNALARTEKLFKGDLIYDRAATLFSLDQLKDITDQPTKIIVDLKSLMKDTQAELGPEALRVEVSLKKASDTFQCTSADLRTACNAEFKGTDRGIFEVLNLGTSQELFFKLDKYVTYGNGNVYFFDTPSEIPVADVGGDKYVGVGVSKGVRIVEGDNSTPENPAYTAMLAADLKKTPFHCDDQPLVDKVYANFGNDVKYPSFFQQCHEKVEKALIGLQVLTTYGKNTKTVTIGGVTKTLCKNIRFLDHTGKEVCIINYFREKYGVAVDPNFPCVFDKRNKDIKYPMSVLKVAKSQRVKTDQGGNQLTEKMIRQTAVLPNDRQKQTKVVADALELASDKMKKLGITVRQDKPVEVKGRLLPTPKINFAGSTQQSGPAWRSGRYIVPMNDARWALLTTERQPPTGFVDGLKRAGNQAGLRVADPVYGATGVTEDAFEQHIAEAKRRGATFVVVISNHKNGHDSIKELEMSVGVATQHVRTESLRKGSQTMANICHKFNLKLGGINFSVTPTDKDALELSKCALIIGLTIIHPQAVPAKDREAGKIPHHPAIIAWGTNGAKIGNGIKTAAQGTNFAGNFRFANPRDVDYNGETLAVTLKNVIVELLQQFLENRGTIPKHIVVYRGGVSEGENHRIATAEKDIFMEAFATMSAKYCPSLTIVAVTKEHNERFYRGTKKEGRAREQNLPPGSVIDTKIVNPEMNEFYLQSHAALQGTAKAAKYTILHEPAMFGMNTYEDLTNSLTYCHQIVASTTAIPTPLYVAEECAKRANEQFQHQKYQLFPNGEIELDKLNQKIAADNALRGIRFNA